MHPSFPTLQGLQPVCHPSKISPRTKRIRETIQVKLSFQIDGFLTGPLHNRMILNQWTKWNNRSLKWLPKTSFIGRLPLRQICDVSQIGVTFHRICPPTFIQTRLQQYSRGTSFYSAHSSSSNPMCFWSVWCRRAMIPGKIFTRFAEFQRIVSENDSKLPIGIQELLQASLCFLWSFCFTQIRLDPLSGQVLHHDCISVIVSSFEIVTENLVICCYGVTKISTTKYGSTIASPARSPSNFGPLADLAISVLKEMRINNVFTHILTFRRRALQRYFTRTGVWVSVFRNFIVHQFFSEFLQPLRDFRACTTWVGKQRVAPFPQQRASPFRVSFDWVLDVDRWTTVVDTVTGDLSLSVRSCRSRVLVSLTVGDEDELEEDVEQWLPSWKYPWSWWIRSRRRIWQAWRHNRHEVLRFAMDPNPVLNEIWFFYHWSIHKNVLVHRKAFRAIILLACFRARIYPILWHTQLPLHASALLHWRLWLL